MTNGLAKHEQKMLDYAQGNGFRQAQWLGEGKYRQIQFNLHDEYPEIRLVYSGALGSGHIGVNWSSSSSWMQAAMGVDFANGLDWLSDVAGELERLNQIRVKENADG